VSIVSSPFSRTLQTAEEFRNQLKAIIDDKEGRRDDDRIEVLIGEITLEVRLRERCFGVFEGKTNEAYERVWSIDEGEEERINTYETNKTNGILTLKLRILFPKVLKTFMQ